MGCSYLFVANAKKKFYSIIEYLNNTLSNKTAAKEFIEEFKTQILLICDFPNLSPVVENAFCNNFEIRKFSVKKYVIYYYFNKNNQTIYILTIRHSLENEENLFSKV